MDEKTKAWLIKRSGKITSSAASPLFTKGKAFGRKGSGKDPKRYNYWSEGAITYLLEKRMEIQEGQPKFNVDLFQFEWGNSQEKNGMEWLRENEGWNVFHADEDAEDKVFKVCDCGLGDSIDGFVMSDNNEIIKLIEQKSPIPWSGPWMYIFSKETTDDQLKIYTIEKYSDQIACHFIAYPDIDELCFFYYKGMNIEDDFDNKSVLDKSRCRIIIFKRSDFGSSIEWREKRIEQADIYLKSNKPISKINDYFDQIYEQ